MRILQVLSLVLASCSLAPAAPAAPLASPPAPELGLPPVRGPLVFPEGASEVSMAWMLGELGRLTGQELAMEPQLRMVLEQSKEALEITTPVPADEVYPFVEALLVQWGVFLAPLKGGTRPVLGVFGAGRGPQSLTGLQPVPVTFERLGDLEMHPAVVVQLVMTFQNIDSRQLQTQLRQLLVDSTGLQQIVPAGERSLLIQGPAAKVSGLARLLTEVDRASAGMPRSQPAPAEARPGPPPASDGPKGNG